MPPDNDTLQLHDLSGGGEDDDDENGNWHDGHDDDALQHVKDLRMVHIELRGHHVVLVTLVTGYTSCFTCILKSSNNNQI